MSLPHLAKHPRLKSCGKMSCRVPGLENMPQNWPPLHFSAVKVLVYWKKQIMRYHEMVPLQSLSLCSNHGHMISYVYSDFQVSSSWADPSQAPSPQRQSYRCTQVVQTTWCSATLVHVARGIYMNKKVTKGGEEREGALPYSKPLCLLGISLRFLNHIVQTVCFVSRTPPMVPLCANDSQAHQLRQVAR